MYAASAFGADFAKDIRPLLERECIGCHGPQRQASGVRLDSAEGFDAVGAETVLEQLQSGTMPPGGPSGGGKLDVAAFAEWVKAGSVWPDGVVLTPKPSAKPVGDKKPVGVVRTMKVGGELTAYSKTILGTTVSYDMVPLKGGEFSMGTAGRKDEEPVRRVRVDSFWMMAHEVTWDEYRLFMFSKMSGEIPGADKYLDSISRPTRPYVEMSFGMGITGFPAISMTQHAANKYAEWLSAKTGEFYRLPTEAEWEYACKAGGQGEPNDLGTVAWYGDNANGKYQKVAAKAANAWGLFDMLGNVMEWTLDQYGPYSAANGLVENPWVKADKPYPHAVRGGSWADGAESCRCGARVGSEAAWKQQDPQLPKSIWYMTDAQGLGFRLVRPMKLPTPAEMMKYWNSGVEKEY